MDEKMNQPLPKTVATHLALYPTAFATMRGLEYIREDGTSEVLVAMRRLSDDHPWLPQSPDEVGTEAPANETQNDQTEEGKDPDIEPEDESDEKTDSEAEKTPEEAAEAERLKTERASKRALKKTKAAKAKK